MRRNTAFSRTKVALDQLIRSASRDGADRPETASAVRSVTSAVASLSRDSPSRIVVILRGSPIRRATAVAATASGGATIAPSTTASPNPMGSSHHATSATPNAVKRTSPTERPRTGIRQVRRSSSEVEMAAA
jgi:hypothetical protein